MSTPPARGRAAAITVAVLVAALGTTLGTTSAASAEPHDKKAEKVKDKTSDGATVSTETYDSFIVHFVDEAEAARDDVKAQEVADEVGTAEQQTLTVVDRLSTDGSLVEVDGELDKEKADKLLARYAARDDVAYVEPNVRMTATLSPNDSNYGLQWHYFEAVAGMNLPTAWDTADGTGVNVAVLDTGITAHSDLNANVVGGYDFVSSATNARDGGGRDSNPADQGDWNAAGECGAGSPASNSSWHGTHVAGTVGAVTQNAAGVTGVAFGAKVVPVRVLAKCGGTLADIADAITWSSGGSVSGVPANPNPAKVINMSLGGSGTCGATYQNAINAAVARGTTVVVAAGNSNANAANFQPASCTSTVVVAASDRQGNRASYSNFGTIVDVTAPGGETATQANGVLSTLNAGTTVPAGEGYAYYQGTSMATPHVAGLAALVLGEKAHTPAELESVLKAGTRPLAGTCSGGCGAGLVDATKTITSLTAAPPPPSTTFTNSVDYTISDGATVESPITVTGRSGAASATTKVDVDIRHTYRGDLQIDLVAPDGSLYRLKSISSSDSADNVIGTYTVNLSSETANGTWRLRVYDAYAGDTGFINSWSITP